MAAGHHVIHTGIQPTVQQLLRKRRHFLLYSISVKKIKVRCYVPKSRYTNLRSTHPVSGFNVSSPNCKKDGSRVITKGFNRSVSRIGGFILLDPSPSPTPVTRHKINCLFVWPCWLNIGRPRPTAAKLDSGGYGACYKIINETGEAFQIESPIVCTSGVWGIERRRQASRPLWRHVSAPTN